MKGEYEVVRVLSNSRRRDCPIRCGMPVHRIKVGYVVMPPIGPKIIVVATATSVQRLENDYLQTYFHQS